MNAVPPRFSIKNLKGYERYICPASNIRAFEANMPEQWVHCPLFNEKPIGYGSCLDIQGLARAEDFETDPFIGLFEELSRKTGKNVKELRKVCLKHQSQLLKIMMNNPNENKNALSDLLNWVEKLETSLKI